MMRHTRPTRIAVAVVIVLFVNFAERIGAQDAHRKINRWAIVAIDATALPLADLLTAELSSADGMELVERDQIDRVLDELKLNAKGLVDRDRASRFGQLSKADALVIIHTSDELVSNAKILRVRLIDTRTSVRLLDTVLPTANLEANVDALSRALRAKIPTLAIPSQRLRAISIAPIMSGEPGHYLRGYCQALTALVGSDFQRQPEFVVLEREDLVRLTTESDLSGVELDLRAATRLLETSIRRTMDNGGIVATCRVAAPGGGQTLTFDVPIASTDITRVRRELVAKVSESIGQHFTDSRATSPENEAKIFDQRRALFRRCYRPEEAVEMAEAAYALAPTQSRMRSLLTEYAMLTRHRFRGENTNAHVKEKGVGHLGSLLAAHRENELLLKNAALYPEVRNGREAPARPRMPPPNVWHQYGKKLMAQTKEERKILAEINTLRQLLLDLRIQQAKEDPISQFRLLLWRLDIEIEHIEHNPAPIETVVGLLRHLYELSGHAAVKREMDDDLYRAFVSRAATVINRADTADQNSRWHIELSELAVNLSEIDPRLGKIAMLVSKTNHKGKFSEDAARELLDAMSAFDHVESASDVIDKLIRWPALQRLTASEASGYAEELVERCEFRQDAEELLTHTYSAKEFFRKPNEHSQQLVSRMFALIEDVPPEHQVNKLRLRAAIHPFSGIQLQSTGELSLADAEGPWQEWVAKPIRLQGWDDYQSNWMLHVDRRSDTKVRGGELILVGGMNRTLSIERIGLSGGHPRKIGPETLHPPTIEKPQIAVGPDGVYLSMSKFGITKITTNATERLTEADGAASNEVLDIAWLKDRLYIAYRDALGSFDPNTKQFELIASSTAVAAKNVFDARGSFIVDDLIADEARNCIWMTVVDFGPERSRNGLWKWTPIENKFERVTKSVTGISIADKGFLLNQSVEPRVALFDRDSHKLIPLPEFAHASKTHSWLVKPTPHLIKVGENLIGSDGSMMTGDGKTYRLAGRHRWSYLQRVGDGFITHYDQNRRTVWHVHPKAHESVAK
ncbi:MAG: CsgG/HfaB family protein [Pirellulaceae bacterium]